MSRTADHIAGRHSSEESAPDTTLVGPSWEQPLYLGSDIRWAAVIERTMAIRQKHTPAHVHLAVSCKVPASSAASS